MIEVLVALVVTSLLLAILMDGAVTARQAKARSIARVEAMRVGQSVLSHMTSDPASPSPSSGEDAGLEWRLHHQPILTDPRGFYQLEEWTVDIFDRDGDRLQSFVSRKLTRARR